MEARKVQRVGYSTLTVSLPRSWVQEVNLKQGDVVSIKREDDGSLRVFSGLEQKHEEAKKCIIDADLCDRPDLLTRLITGNYILGHDTIQVVSKRELKPEHLEETRRATQRLTGLGVVEQTLRQVTVQFRRSHQVPRLRAGSPAPYCDLIDAGSSGQGSRRKTPRASE